MDNADGLVANPDFSLANLLGKFSTAWGMVGGEKDDLNKLAEDPRLMAQVIAAIRGNAKITGVKHVVCSDEPPRLRRKWKVAKHYGAGKFTLKRERNRLLAESDGKKFEIVLVPISELGVQQMARLSGVVASKEAEGTTFLNSNFLEYLFAHPELIPWFGVISVFFLGTFYTYTEGGIEYTFVRTLQMPPRGSGVADVVAKVLPSDSWHPVGANWLAAVLKPIAA